MKRLLAILWTFLLLGQSGPIIMPGSPLPGLSAPENADVERVLALIASSPSPVFVHCEHGADRTGTIVACYRMRHDGWTAAQAMAEAQRHGISVFQFGMKRFIRGFTGQRK